MRNNTVISDDNKIEVRTAKETTLMQHILYNKWLYIMLIPGVLYFLAFRFAPMWGISIAFKDYSPYLGFSGSEWIGVSYFKDFFASPDFFRLLSNTLVLGVLNVTVGFGFPILLALLLNEMKAEMICSRSRQKHF